MSNLSMARIALAENISTSDSSMRLIPKSVLAVLIKLAEEADRFTAETDSEDPYFNRLAHALDAVKGTFKP